MLHVSIKTVQAYCARMKEKLNLHSGSELMREAVRHSEAQGVEPSHPETPPAD
jgi:DNA-binding CsgD family transcriptional regulator